MVQNIIQSNSIIVDSIIVENSKIVDDLAATKDFYLIKIHNSRNSKIVELFWRGCEKFSLLPIIFALIFSRNVLHSYLNVPPYMCCSDKMIIWCCSLFLTSLNSSDLISLRIRICNFVINNSVAHQHLMIWSNMIL